MKRMTLTMLCAAVAFSGAIEARDGDDALVFREAERIGERPGADRGPSTATFESGDG